MLKKVPSKIKNHRTKRLSRHSGILFRFSGASLCFGRTETLLCEAGKSRWSK